MHIKGLEIGCHYAAPEFPVYIRVQENPAFYHLKQCILVTTTFPISSRKYFPSVLVRQ